MGKPANIAKFAAQLFARSDAAVADTLNANIAEKITKLEGADSKLTGKPVDKSVKGFEPAALTASRGPLVLIAAGSDSDMPIWKPCRKSWRNSRSNLKFVSARHTSNL